MSDYTITTETTRVFTIRLTEQQALDLLADEGDARFELMRKIKRAVDPQDAAPLKRQARTAKEKPAAQPAPKAAAPSKGNASTQVRCAQCGKTVAARGLKVHLRKCPKSAPATAGAAASSD